MLTDAFSKGSGSRRRGAGFAGAALLRSAPFFLAPPASGFLLFLAFPRHDHGWLAWIGLVPLLLVLSGRKPLAGFVAGYLCGLVFFPGLFTWILHASGYTYLHHILLDLYLSLFCGLFGFLYAFIASRLGTRSALAAAPFLWVSVEYLRSNLSFLALPWGLLAHSQHAYPTIIQVASLVGAYGVSFWVVSLNSFLTFAALSLLTGLKRKGVSFGMHPRQGPAWRPVWLSATISSVVCIGVPVLYGLQATATEGSGRPIRVSVVQGNIPQRQKSDRRYAKKIRDSYSRLTAMAVNEKPDLIVWPETATPGPINRDGALLHWVQSLADSANVPLLVGSAQVHKFQRRAPGGVISTNSAFLIVPGGKGNLERRYDKMRLFPFGEYLPYRNILPWSVINVPDIRGFQAGKECTLFAFPGGPFGVTICWENVFPDIVREFVKRGARFMVNITNEAWFGKTAAPYQILSMNVFRAVENGVYVVRCANTGISCVIDPHGRIVKRVRDDKGNDTFVSGTVTASIIPLRPNTFYTLHGDWLVWVCIAFCGIILVASLVKRRRDRRKSKG